MSTERDNRMVWDGRPGHYEVWYTTLSHRASKTGFWIRYTLRAPVTGRGEPYAQLWFARFDAARPEDNFGIHTRRPITELVSNNEPFAIRIGSCETRQDGLRGSIAGDGHEASWDLSWTPASETHHHLPTVLYKGSLGDTKVLSPNLVVPTRGHITVDGRRYEFDGDPAGQTHLWGKKHAYHWAWSHVNAFDGGEHAAFESITARLKRGAVILPKMTAFTLYLDGEKLDFREPWRIPFNRSDYATGHLHIIGVGAETRVEASFDCRPQDMILTEYVDPDGDAAFCHNTCAGNVKIVVKRRSPFVGRWKEDRTLTATGTAHWEWGARAGDIANVKRIHIAV